MSIKLTIGDQDYLGITIRRYVRPDGAVRDEDGYVPWTDDRAARYDALTNAGRRLTFEQIRENQVSLCVEDDETDFAIELVPNEDAATTQAICALIDGYGDPALYAT